MSETFFLTGGSGLMSVNFVASGFKKFKIILGLNNRVIEFEQVVITKFFFGHYIKLKEQLIKFKPNILINTAGITSVENCELYPDLAMRINGEMPKLIAKVCKELKIVFVHISTDHLFDGSKAFRDENERLSPLNFYAKSKALAEQNITTENEKAIIIRTNFFGWGPSYRASFSDRIIKNIRIKKEIGLFEDVFITPILLETFFNLLIALVRKKSYGIFNVVSNERLSKYEYGLMLAKVFGLDTSLINKTKLYKNKNFVRRPLDMSLSNKKIKNHLSTEIISLEEQFQVLKKQENLKCFKEVINLW